MTTNGCSCGCCAGLADQTPARILNRPGLGAVAYRAGTYGRFRNSMIAGLNRADRPALTDLKSREPADFSLALIDAWAVACDVLTFYTERSANENYLGTATERGSVSGIVGLIGYRLRAGVAAQAALAFTLDISPGSPATVPIPTGAKVQTLPGPGEQPQTFETIEDLTALAAWNAPLVRQTEPRVPQDGDKTVLLAGAATNVNRGDTLLFVAGSADASTGFATARVSTVAVDAANQRTAVSFRSVSGTLGAATTVKVYAMRQRAALFGYNAASPLLFVPEVKTALGKLLKDSEWAFLPLNAAAVDLDAVYEGIAADTPVLLLNGGTTRLASISALSDTSRTAYGISAKVTRLDLGDADLTAFGGTATRGTVLLLRAEELTLAEVPVTAPVRGEFLDLNAPLAAPQALPRPILVRGRRARVRTTVESAAVVTFEDGSPEAPAGLADLTVLAIRVADDNPDLWTVRIRTGDGTTGTITTAAANFVFLPARAEDPILGEAALVEEIDGAKLLLAEPLKNVYDRFAVAGRRVEIWGNVAAATHGESVLDEVLGSGDASRQFQRFTLRRPPLTVIQAANAAGGESTLRVWVNGVQWQEVPSLFGHGPRDRVYATMTDDEGKTVVLFGDGSSGARPPTGHENIRASYRAGTGLAGLAAAGQLSLLMTRPLGVTGVRNPLAAAGAQDPEPTSDAAGNAPRTVLTLDRIVSLRDYEDFAANFAGIGKATATWTWDGAMRGVALSVAGVGGLRIEEAGPLLANLTAAVAGAGNPRVPLVVRPAAVGLFTLEASLVLDPAYVAETVLEAARAALLDHFSFPRRAFGQIVSLGEVAGVLHAVRGVTGALVVRLHRTGEPAYRNPFLPARSLLPGKPPAEDGAEVLAINPDQTFLNVEV